MAATPHTILTRTELQEQFKTIPTNDVKLEHFECYAQEIAREVGKAMFQGSTQPGDFAWVRITRVPA